MGLGSIFGKGKKTDELAPEKPPEEMALDGNAGELAAEQIINDPDNGDIPIVNDAGSGAVILEDENKKPGDQESEPGENGDAPEVSESDSNDGLDKAVYEFTRDQLGDIAGDKKIQTDTEEIAAFIQKMETDPLTRKKTFHKVQWFGEDYGSFPISHQDMADALEPGKYYVRVVDANEVRKYFGGFRVDIGVEEPQAPAADEKQEAVIPAGSFPPGSVDAANRSVDDRIKAVEALVVQTSQAVQAIAGNMVQKTDPQQLMNTMLMSMMQKTLEGGNGSEKVIEKIADMMTKTQEMMMGFRTKVEEKKIDFDFEKLRAQNEMELKKMELTLAKGMPVDEEGKKSKNTLQTFIDGFQSFMATAGPALKEIRKLRELEMGIAPTGDEVASEPEAEPPQ